MGNQSSKPCTRRSSASHLPPSSPPTGDALPDYTSSKTPSHQFGAFNEAPEAAFHAAEAWCAARPVTLPRLLASYDIDAIRARGVQMWGLYYPNEDAHTAFRGFIMNPEPDEREGEGRGRKRDVTHVRSFYDAQDPERDFCLLSNLPLLAGKYDASEKKGAYYEVKVIRMNKSQNGIVAVGLACKPYPLFRLPGWNRLSAGLHLDDLRVFYEDPTGGHDYASDSSLSTQGLRDGDVIGCGVRHPGQLFFTHNGRHLGDVDVYPAVFMPPQAHDVYAAVGVEGECEIEVNFGGEPFVWKEGNDQAWSAIGHVGGRMAESSGMESEEPPRYSLVS